MLSWLFRRWAREQANISRRIASFEVDQTTCFREEDRSIVYQNIASLMRAADFAGRESGQREALEAFNCLVRRRLVRSLTASIGPVGLNYRHVAGVILLSRGSFIVDI